MWTLMLDELKGDLWRHLLGSLLRQTKQDIFSKIAINLLIKHEPNLHPHTDLPFPPLSQGFLGGRSF